MSVTIKNLTSRSLFVPLNSGTNLRLSPGEVSEEVHAMELKENSKIEKLKRQRAIAIELRKEEEGGAKQAEKTAETKAEKTNGPEGETGHRSGVEADGGEQKSEPA
jgi:hypothetical protein